MTTSASSTSHEDQPPLSAPIADLQVRIAFLDDLVEQLNTQMVLQAQQLATLQQQMQLLYRRVEASDAADGIASFDPMIDKPPHY